jgi:TRAP-type C4-dicarboxylate transport system permease small subunit
MAESGNDNPGMNMDGSAAKTRNRWVRWNDLDEQIGIFFLATMCILAFLQIVMRYVFNHPLFWVEEVTIMLSIWLVFLGAGVAARRGLHIAIEVIPFSSRGRSWVAVVIGLMVIFFFILLFIGAVPLMIELRGVRTPALRIPTSWIMLSFPVGAVVITVSYVRTIIKEIKNLRNTVG